MGKREASSTTADSRDHEAISRDATPSLVRERQLAIEVPATTLRRGYWMTVAAITRVVACIGGCILAGASSAALSPLDGWYVALRKPGWMPPGWLFGPIWSVLYAMMGLAWSLVLARGWHAGGVRRATLLFAVQLALNLAWSPVFFRGHSPGAAMAIIVVLWFLVGWTVAAFWSVRDVAGLMLLPYWMWLTFAVALNASIWRMN